MSVILGLGVCAFCEGGIVGVRVPVSGKRFVGQCDECDAVWLDPERRDGPHFLAQPLMLCPDDGSSLWSPPAHWATREEIANTAWASAITSESVTRN